MGYWRYRILFDIELREVHIPFKSQAQSRAAFSGALGLKMKADAKEWASKTDYKHLPKKVGKTKVSPSNVGSHFTESAADIPIERANHFQEGNAVLAREQMLKNLGANESKAVGNEVK